MSLCLEENRKLSYAEKLARLRLRAADPKWRRYAMTVAGGKMLGFALTLLIMGAITVGPKLLESFFGSSAFGQQAAAADAATSTQPTSQPTSQPAAAVAAAAAPATPLTVVPNATDPYVSPINTVWTLVAAFLVFCMQVGFTMLEAGFCRSRETVNVLVECVFDTCLCGLLFYAFGYAFMFGQGNGLIGWHDPLDVAGATGKDLHCWFFLKNINANTVYGATGVPVLAHWVFQFAFADCASMICSGTMIGRTGFIGDILYSVCVSGFIYPIIGHWAWGPDGMLYTMGGLNIMPSLPMARRHLGTFT